jgi:hypothetical protein
MKQHFDAISKSSYYQVFRILGTAALLVIAAVLLLNTRAQCLAAAPPESKLVCDEPEYDFGERDNLTKVEHAFLLRNAGDDPLTISRVLTTCGCTAAKLEDKTLAPGETVPLNVEVTLEGRKGPFEKRIYVMTEGQAAKTKLTIKGKSIERVRIEPENVGLVNTPTDRAISRDITLTSLVAEAKFNIKQVAVDSKYLEAGFESSEDGMKHVIHVKTKPPLPKGHHPATIRVFTNHEDYPRIDIRAGLQVVGKVRIMPEEIVVYDRGPGESETAMRFINVMAGSVQDYEVVGVESEVEGIQTEIIARPGGRYLVKVENIPVSPALDGKTVTIVTDIEGAERLTVPFRVKEYPRPGAGAASSSAPAPPPDTEKQP